MERPIISLRPLYRKVAINRVMSVSEHLYQGPGTHRRLTGKVFPKTPSQLHKDMPELRHRAAPACPTVPFSGVVRFIMNTRIFSLRQLTTGALICFVLIAVATWVQAAPVVNEKCATTMAFDPTPSSTVTEGTDVTLTQTVTTTTLGSGSGVCGLAIGSNVNDGILRIHKVTAGGIGLGCYYRNKKYCTVGESVNPDGTCANQNDCLVDVGNGVCTNVTDTGAGNLIAEENPTTDGTQSALVSTTGLGGSVLGFLASYVGQANFLAATDNCTDVTIEVDDGGGPGECDSGLTIGIHLSSGNGRPPSPGGPYNWSYEVIVHACEDLYGVTAQGGTNGWALLANGRDEVASLHPGGDFPTSAEVRKANRKTDVILWTIGDMVAGDTVTLGVDLSGSIKNTVDCQELFLSGPWSALFSTDGFVFEKTDYTGRVFIKTDTNGNPDDCDL